MTHKRRLNARGNSGRACFLPGCLFAVLPFAFASTGITAPLNKPPQAITQLKTLYRETALIQQGRLRVRIIRPDNEAYIEPAQAVAAALRAMAESVAAKPSGIMPGDPWPAIKTDKDYRTSDRNYHLICLGQMNNNRLAFELYVRHLIAADDWYPGPDGHVMRTVSDPFGKSSNVIFLGGSDSAGVKKAVARFTATLEALAADPAFRKNPAVPYLMDIQFRGKDKMSAFLPKVRDEFKKTFVDQPSLPYFIETRMNDLARNWYLTGHDAYAEALADGIRRWMKEYYKWTPPRQITTPKYLIPYMLLDWDMVEEHPAFDNALRLEYTNLLYDYVSRMSVHSRISQLKPGVLAGTGHHNVTLTVSYGGKYFTTYYPKADLTRINQGLKSVRTGLNTIKNTYGFFDENGGYTQFYPTVTMHNSLFMNDLHYFSSGHAKDWLYQSLIYTSNLKWRYCGKDPQYGPGEWYDRNGHWIWLQNQLTNRTDYGPRVTKDQVEFTAWSYLPKIEPVRPDNWLNGIQWLPVHQTTFKYMKRKGKQINVPRAKTFHLISLRQTYDRMAEFLRMDGINDGLENGGDGNALNTYTDKGQGWLIYGKWGSHSPKYHNRMIILKNGLMAEKEPALCALEAVADLPDSGLVQSVLYDLNSTDWARNILWRKGKWFVICDTVRAREPGDFSLLCRWRSYIQGTLHGPRYTKTKRGVSCDIVGDGYAQTFPSMVDITYPYFTQALHGQLKQGDAQTFFTLFQTRPEKTHPLRMERVARNVTLVRDPDGPVLIGALMPQKTTLTESTLSVADRFQLKGVNDCSLALSARMFLLSEQSFAATDFTGWNKTIGGQTDNLMQSDQPIHLEINWENGSISALAKQACTLQIREESFPIKGLGINQPSRDLKPQTFTLSQATRVRLRQAANECVAAIAQVPALKPPPAADKRAPDLAKPLLQWNPQTAPNINPRHFGEALCVAPADLNGDGVPEACIGYSRGAVAAVDASGKLLWSFLAKSQVNDLHVGDINQDGRIEILAASDDFNLYCLDASGKEQWRFNTQNIPLSHQIPAIYGAGRTVSSEGEVLCVRVADLDNDGANEIIVGTKTFKHGNLRVFGTIFCLDPTGKLKWHTYQSGGCVISMDIKDINGNGKKEIALGTGGRTYGTYMHLLDSQGALLRSYAGHYGEKYVALARLRKTGPFRLVRMEMRNGDLASYATEKKDDPPGYVKPLWTYPCGGLTSAGPAIADLKGDGNMEIIVASSSGNLYVIGETAEGTAKEIWRRNLQEPIAAVSAADLLGGPEPEIIAGGQLGTLYVLDRNGRTVSATNCGSAVSVLETKRGKTGKASLWAAMKTGALLQLQFE